jgi:D-methionine transport system ATP-binding protein
MASLLEIQHLSKSYPHGSTQVRALCDLSFSIQKGEVFGIIGLSGAGKSTLMRVLCSLTSATEGRVLFEGQDIASMDKAALRTFRRNIGMIFQHFNLLQSRNVEENIAYPLEIAGMSLDKQKTRVDTLLSLVGLQEKAKAYPCQLSGGEKQRVGIARALAANPKVLFCDEATSALDPKTTSEILALLKQLQAQLGLTIVLITHEMEVIKQICHKVAVMQAGQIIEEGTVSQVFVDPRHPITKQFLQRTSHDIPPEFFKPFSPNRRLLRLSFKENTAKEPVISDLVKKFDINANILMGWIDRLEAASIGVLVIELTGSSQGITSSLSYLEEKDVHYEVLENEL